jgi:hypothetical protein
MKPRPIKTGAIAGLCALGGAVAGIAGSAAAPSSHKPVARASQSDVPRAGFAIAVAGGKPGAPGALPAPPVHSELVVPNQAGNGFDTITSDRGSFQSLAGDQLTITEGTKTAAYKTLTLTIPSDATVYRNDAQAKLTDLQSGDEVMVTKAPSGTTVSAADAQHQREPLGQVTASGGKVTKVVPPDGSPLPPPPPGA